MSKGGYGIPLFCPKCPPSMAHRMLKTPNVKVPTCSDCGTLMVPCDPVRREAWKRKSKSDDAVA